MEGEKRSPRPPEPAPPPDLGTVPAHPNVSPGAPPLGPATSPPAVPPTSYGPAPAAPGSYGPAPPPGYPPDPGAAAPPPQPPARGPQPPAAQGYPPYYPSYPSYPYYTPYYPYPWPPSPPKPPEPRQLRTVQAFDSAVLALFVLGAAFAWSALVGSVAAAAMGPALGGQALLGNTQAGWLNGVMIARVIVWAMFLLAGALSLVTLSKLNEGKLEFGPAHERRTRELQTSGILFALLAGGAGLVGYILAASAPAAPNPFAAPDNVEQLRSLQDSLRLGALVWAAGAAVTGMLFSTAFTRMLREFLPPEDRRPLAVVPVIFLFVPLLHAALSIAFLQLPAVDTNTWTASSLAGAAEAGGIAGIAAAVPILFLTRSLRAAQDRILSGEVKSEALRRPA